MGGDDTAFTRRLHEAQNLTILPGSFMARQHDGLNPGNGRVRISLVAGVALSALLPLMLSNQ